MERNFGQCSCLFTYALLLLFFLLPLVSTEAATSSEIEIGWMQELITELDNLPDLNFEEIFDEGEEDYKQKSNSALGSQDSVAEISLIHDTDLTFYSTETGGLWHSPTTWEHGIVPGEDSHVVIRSGFVESKNDVVIASLRVEEGAHFRTGNASVFYDMDFDVESVINRGTIDGQNTVNFRILDSLENSGTIYNNIVWAGGKDGKFVSEQAIFTTFVLETDIRVSTDLEIRSFTSNGNFMYAVNRPTFVVPSQIDSLLVHGAAVIYAGNGPNGAYKTIDASDSILHLQTGYLNENITAKEIFMDQHYNSGRYNLGNGITISAERINILNEATLYYYKKFGTTRNIYFIGDVYNDGYVQGTLDIHINGNIENKRGWAVKNTYMIGPDETRSYSINDGSVVLLNDQKTQNIDPYITSRNKNKVQFYGQDNSKRQEFYINYDLDNLPNRYHFETTIFFGQIGDQETDIPFAITIYADDNFSGVLYLHSNSGDVYPNKIKMQNGQWSGDVSMFDAGDSNQLFINQGEKYGVSNAFRVVDGISLRTSTLLGSVIDGTLLNRQTLANQQIFLYPDTDNVDFNQAIKTAVSDDNGRFEIPSLACGDYLISAEPENSEHRNYKKISVSCGGFSINDVSSTQCSSSNKTPVLLIPGIMGSDSVTNRTSLYPILPKGKTSWNSGEIEIHDPDNYLIRIANSDIGFNRLTEDLEDNGHVFGCDVFHVAYDWTLPLHESAKFYLKPWIEHAKRMSGHDQVDLVSHSMGGLVARSYLQGYDYDNDVQKFVMAGTPNQGSLGSYPAWAGGDPILADEIGASADKLIAEYFQTNTINKNHIIRTGSDPLCKFENTVGLGSVFGNLFIPPINNPISCDNSRVHEYLHQSAQSVGNLMPTFTNPLFGFGSDIVYEENKFLKQLNGQPCSGGDCGFSEMIKTGFSEIIDSVDVHIFYGEGAIESETVRSLPVLKSSDGLYEDGKVVDGLSPLYGLGDKTVLSESAIIDGVRDDFGKINHTGLIRFFVQEIINFITN